jgi:hypothetical protein
VSRRKKKPGRRVLAPVEHHEEDAPAVRVRTPLERVASAASTVGVTVLLAALAVQYKVLPGDVGPNGALAMKVAGGVLIVLGLVLGRRRR